MDETYVEDLASEVGTALVATAEEDGPVWVEAKKLSPGSLVHTDGWEGYAGLENKGYRHEVTVLRGKRQSASKLLPRKVHRVASLDEYLDYYLDEFTFRFNQKGQAVAADVVEATGPAPPPPKWRGYWSQLNTPL